jgi:hypothetical protein
MIAAFDFRRQIAFVKFVGKYAEYHAIDALAVPNFDEDYPTIPPDRWDQGDLNGYPASLMQVACAGADWSASVRLDSKIAGFDFGSVSRVVTSALGYSYSLLTTSIATSTNNR